MNIEQYFLMKPADAERYTRENLHCFSPNETLTSEEIGDGNINYVTRVRSQDTGKSVILKQADRLLRSSGRPLDSRRSQIEAEALRLQNQLAPGFVPKIYEYNPMLSLIVMEDLVGYQKLRTALWTGAAYETAWSEALSDFLVRTLLPTSDLILPPAEKKRRVQNFINPELCDITEDLVLREPYDNYKNRNIITPGNEDFVRENLYENQALHTEAGKLRYAFMNHAQALLHGDLHTGSVFVKEADVKIIDAEFAFYGPIGYDIGCLLGNLIFPLVRIQCDEDRYPTRQYSYSCFHDKEARQEAIISLENLFYNVYTKTRDKFALAYQTQVRLPLYQTDAFRAQWLAGIMSDALGYAGMELIRRTVGDTKVVEITSVEDLKTHIYMERILIRIGRFLLLKRKELTDPADILSFIAREVWDA